VFIEDKDSKRIMINKREMVRPIYNEKKCLLMMGSDTPPSNLVSEDQD